MDRTSFSYRLKSDKVRGGSCHRSSVTIKTQRRAVKGQVLVRHRANRGLVGHEPRKVGADVRRAVLVPIQWKHAVSLCATPQSTNSFLLLAWRLCAARVGPPGPYPEPPPLFSSYIAFLCSVRQRLERGTPLTLS